MSSGGDALSNPSAVPEGAGAAQPGKSFFQRWGWVLLGLLAAAVVVLLLAPAASEDPDGLDRVSNDEEFAEEAEDPYYEWLPDYTIPGVDNEWVSVVIAGLIGVIVVFLVAIGAGEVMALSRRRAKT